MAASLSPKNHKQYSLIPKTFTNDGFGLWMKCQGGVGKVAAKHLFWWFDSPSIAVFAGVLNVKGVIVRLPPCFAVLMVKMVRGKHLSLLTNIADGNHHQQQNFSWLLPCDK